ncbi:MAG: hypothetical protein ACI9F9_003038 [Candidatus Paceibacteria bacterium]|jgi:hypothetical protein
MITTLLCLFPFLPQSATLQVPGVERTEWVAGLGTGQTTVLLPLNTDSDRIARAIPGTRGTELQLAATRGRPFELQDLQVLAIPHAHGERILLADGQLHRVHDISLPASIESESGPALAKLVRQDQAGVVGETITISKGPQGSRLVLLPMESEKTSWALRVRCDLGPWQTLTSDLHQGHGLTLEGGATWELQLGDVGLDQAFHAQLAPLTLGSKPLRALQVRRVHDCAPRHAPRNSRGPVRSSLTPRDRGEALQSPETLVAAGEVLRLFYALPPPADPSHSLTLLVQVRVREMEASGTPAAWNSPSAAPYFRDNAKSAGVFDVHFEGPRQQLDIRPTMGPGAAWGDFDGDGLPDLYLVQGGGREGSAKPLNQLLRNLGNGRFERVPGAEDTGAGMGALFFDLEGDGDLDLYVANYGADALFRNDGQGEFVDVSGEHDLARSEWSAGVCAADYDGDGDLDLYVTSYLVYDTDLMPPVESLPGYAREDPTEMLPFAFPGSANTFLENVNGKLTDRTEALGVADEQGRGMQPAFWDFDLDGDQDLYIANDVSMNVLYRNEGNGTFKDVSFQVGMDDPRGGMGVAIGDVDFDGDTDLFLTNWQLEANALYRNNRIVKHGRKSRTGTFQDVTVHSKLGAGSVGKTSWGAVFFDADNDGDLDLFIPNGYTSPDYESTSLCVGQSNQFFLNDGTGRFEDATQQAGAAVSAPLASRSAAVCDYDRDGKLDLFVTNNNGPYQLLHNELPNAGHWVGLELRAVDGNSAAIGARAVIEVDGVSLVREVTAGGGYLAGHASELHFGLGSVEDSGPVTVHWPSGQVSEHELAGIDRWIELEEPR